MSSLKHHKDEVGMIKLDQECGICLTKTIHCQPGDQIICYEVVQKKQKLDWEPVF